MKHPKLNSIKSFLILTDLIIKIFKNLSKNTWALYRHILSHKPSHKKAKNKKHKDRENQGCSK